MKWTNIFINEMKRVFLNWKFLLIIILETIFITFYTYVVVAPGIGILSKEIAAIESGKSLTFLTGALYNWLGLSHNRYSIILFAVTPIIAALPYGASLYMDEKNRYLNQIILRGGKRPYYLSKLAGLFLSGGLIAVYPFLLSLLMSMSILPVEHVSVAAHEFIVGNIAFISLLYNNTTIYLIMMLLWLFLIYGLLNCLCFVGSYLFSNRFIVASFPFAVYFATGVLGQFAPLNATPWVYGRMENMTKDMLWIALLEIIVIVVTCLSVCIHKMSERDDAI